MPKSLHRVPTFLYGLPRLSGLRVRFTGLVSLGEYGASIRKSWAIFSFVIRIVFLGAFMVCFSSELVN